MNEIAPHENSSAPSEYRRILFQEEQATDLRDYWFVIYRHRRAALAFLFLTLFLAAISIPWGDPLYTASTTLYIQSQTQGIFNAPEAVGAGTNYYETQRNLLTSRSLVAQVIRDLGLEQNPHFRQRPERPVSWVIKPLRQSLATAVEWVEGTTFVKWIQEYLGVVPEEQPKTREFELGVHPAMIDLYLEVLTVSTVPASQLVAVKFSSSDPSLSKTVVNSHAATFISRNLATRFELTDETRQFLENKLVELKVNVENSEKALNQFQKDHEIVSLDKGNSLLLDQLKRLNTDLTDTRSKRIELESLHRLVQKGDSRLLSQIIDNPTIQNLRKQITGLETQLAHVATKFKPTYRGFIALQQEINEAKSRLDEEVNRIVHTIEKDYGAATAKERALAAEAEKARQVALNLQEKAVEYAVLEREVVSNRALYEAVFKKTKEAALTGEEPMPNLRVVDRAEIPVLPDAGKGTRTLLLSIGIGLFGGIGLAFLLNLLDSTLRTPEDVVRFLRLPTLGVVPDYRQLMNKRAHGLGYTEKISPPQDPLDRQRGENNEIVVSHHPLSLMGEVYRSIRTAILFSRADKPPKTILITSSQPDEGKTVTAINLSIMLAQSGGPVLLIDADLRGGQCHKLLGLGNGNGLTNILTGNGDATSLIKKTSVNNLSLLCRGTLPPNPADLLGSEKMRQTLDALAADFRFLVIDSAPLLPVSDAVLLSAQVDGVILVARGEEVSRHLVLKARERLDYVNAKILGVVLNGIDIWSAEYREYRQVYGSHYTRYAEDKGGESWQILPASAKQAGETIPAEFFDTLVAKFTKFVGPTAFIIVHDRIAALGESPDAFPQARLEELIKAVIREISDKRLKDSFQKQMSEEIRHFNRNL